jgi:hypothetical protein
MYVGALGIWDSAEHLLNVCRDVQMCGDGIVLRSAKKRMFRNGNES